MSVNLTYLKMGNVQMARCGSNSVGMVYPSPANNGTFYWDLFCGIVGRPVKGVQVDEASAKASLEEVFSDFLRLTGLQQIAPKDGEGGGE